MAKTSAVRKEWMERFFSVPDLQEQQTPIFNLNTATPEENAEQKVQRYIGDSMGKYNRARQGGMEDILSRKKQREDEEGQKNLGRLASTVLGHVLTGGNTRRTAMNILPTLAEVSKGEELNKLMEGRDLDDYNVAMKSYMDNIIKGQEFFKSTELEQMRSDRAMELEKLKQGAQDNFQKQLIQDDTGNWHAVSFDKQRNKFAHEPLGIKGRPKGELTPYQEEQLKRGGERDERDAQKEIQRLKRTYEDNNITIRSLEAGKEGTNDFDKLIEDLKKSNPKYAGMNKAKVIETLEDEQIEIESDINYWQDAAKWEKPEGFYTGKKKAKAKNPLGVQGKSNY